MVWRGACAIACVGWGLLTGGCASQSADSARATSSLGMAVKSLTVSFKPADERGSAWEDAVIAQAIAAHEMRNP
jgi:hypothetical protein